MVNLFKEIYCIESLGDIMANEKPPNFCLPLETLPKKVSLSAILDRTPHIFVEQKETVWLVTMRDAVIGNTHCLLCGASVDLFDKYCRMCGAKTTGRDYGNEFEESF